MFGYYRLASAVPQLRVAEVDYNVDQLTEGFRKAAEQQAAAVVFPELCITGYSCGDLFFQPNLRKAALNGLLRFTEATEGSGTIAVVGLPFLHEDALYNTAAVVQSGRILALVPKTVLPNYREFYEKRQFTSGRELGTGVKEVTINGVHIPFGEEIVFMKNRLPSVLAWKYAKTCGASFLPVPNWLFWVPEPFSTLPQERNSPVRPHTGGNWSDSRAADASAPMSFPPQVCMNPPQTPYSAAIPSLRTTAGQQRRGNGSAGEAPSSLRTWILNGWRRRASLKAPSMTANSFPCRECPASGPAGTGSRSARPGIRIQPGTALSAFSVPPPGTV